MRGIYAITPTGWPSDKLLAACKAVLEAGVCALQYRAKPAPDANTAAALLALCAQHDTPLIINDDLALAEDLACGVHVGRDDAQASTARERLPTGALVGASAYADLARAHAAQAAGASYVAFGSVFASATKPGAAHCPLGVITAARQSLTVPRVAIGGIHAGNAAQVFAAGADCVALVDGIFGQDDPAAAVRSLRAAFEAHAQKPA